MSKKETVDKNIADRAAAVNKEAELTANKLEDQADEQLIGQTGEQAAKNKKEESPEAQVPMTRAQKFLSKFDLLGDLFVLNIYFFITSLPIITIGASFTALYTVTNKMVKNEEGPVRQEYFKAFKSNFKQSTLIWIVDLIYIYLMWVQYAYYLTHENEVTKYLFVRVGFEFILLAFALPLQFPLAARYENTTFNIIRNALILAIANLGVWFRMFFIWLFPVMIYYLRPNLLVYTWYLWGMILTALWTYVCSMFLVKFYNKIENREAEND